jgi:hypothetical protein
MYKKQIYCQLSILLFLLTLWYGTVQIGGVVLELKLMQV